MRRAAFALVIAACGSPSKPPPAPPAPPTSDPPAAPPTGKPTAPVPPPAVVAPDAPAGDAAKRDAELAVKAAPYFDAFLNVDPVLARDNKRVVFVSNRDGLPQLYVAPNLTGPATRILTTTERVSRPQVTTEGKSVVFRSDTGADENWSIFRVGLDGKDLVELTPGKKLQRDEPIIPDGKPSTMFFSAREMSSAKSTVYSAPSLAPGEPKAIYTDDRPAELTDVSADGKTAIVTQFPSQSENYVLAVDVDTGKTKRIFPTSGKVTVGMAKLSRDGKRVVVATDNGEEQALVLVFDVATGKQLAKRALTPATATIDGIAVAKEGGAIALSLTAGNHAEIRILDGRSLADRASPQLPLGAGAAVAFSEDGKQLTVVWSTPESPHDLFLVDTQSGKVQARREPRTSLPAAPAIDVSAVDIPAFDGKKIPANVYIPRGERAKKHPTLVIYHGGPAGVSAIRWFPSTAFFLSLGYAVVEPNVRGSSGYGRAYEEADNGPRRLDAFKDIETSARWVATQPWADKDRLVVFGGSYGGYTTLIALTRWPDIWRAGVDVFGVVDLQSFMATTSGLIREIFLLEFGDPDKDRDFLASISPIHDLAKITDPLFVYAGANDPRVPRSESDQVVRALRSRKLPVEYMVAANEGHSLSRKENAVTFHARCARFLEAALR